MNKTSLIVSGIILALSGLTQAQAQTTTSFNGVKCKPGSISLTKPGKYAIKIPAIQNGCSTIHVVLKGGAGGSADNGAGGEAGKVEFDIPAGEFSGLWQITVGQAGANSSGFNGANGGGYSSVSYSGYTSPANRDHVFGVAGGGGGGAPGQIGGAGGEPKASEGAGSGEMRCDTGGLGGLPYKPGAGGKICLGLNNHFGASYNGSYLRGGNGQGIAGGHTAGFGNGGIGSPSPKAGYAGSGGGGGGLFGGGGGTDGSFHHMAFYFDGGGGGGADYAAGVATNIKNFPGGYDQKKEMGKNGYVKISW